ncbi:hypothetical protein ACWDFH_14085 [Streptomyces kronopolitis]|uniref:hypothetical protein n=1 Tax=Streptomyces kronopolitis TaxID=1612435 RepID=UPI0036D05383
MQRAQKLRLTGLAGLAVLAIVVPLGAATAGPAHRVTPGAQPGAAAKAENSSSVETVSTAESGADPDRAPAPGTDSGTVRPGPGPDRFPGRTARCGPELTVPQGIEAQTCVLSRAGRTRARTYYRNRTGRPLRAALTLLRPDGGAVQVNCAVPVAGAPGMCETPAGPTVHAGGLPYAAVAEVSDAAGERLLLRSGSNSPLRSGGSER